MQETFIVISKTLDGSDSFNYIKATEEEVDKFADDLYKILNTKITIEKVIPFKTIPSRNLTTGDRMSE